MQNYRVLQKLKLRPYYRFTKYSNPCILNNLIHPLDSYNSCKLLQRNPQDYTGPVQVPCSIPGCDHKHAIKRWRRASFNESLTGAQRCASPWSLYPASEAAWRRTTVPAKLGLHGGQRRVWEDREKATGQISPTNIFMRVEKHSYNCMGGPIELTQWKVRRCAQ